MHKKALPRIFALLCSLLPISVLAQQAYLDEPEMTPVAAPSAVRIAINKEYFEACEAELGPFPQETVNCPAAVLIPTERTLSDGSVVPVGKGLPESTPRFRGLETGQLTQNPDTQLFDDITTCDKPSGIFRDMRNAGCMPGNRIKHLSSQIKGGQVVDWVYICRKNSDFPGQNQHYNELGLIGYNRNTGKTCYFAGQPTHTLKLKGQWKVLESKDGKPVETTRTEADIPLLAGENIPAPSYTKFDVKMVIHWSVPTMGGCVGCHSSGPFVRYPFNEPVCLVGGGSDNCSMSFSSREVCVAHLEKEYAGKERLKHQCRTLKPKRQPGMLYSVVSPFDATGELNKFLLAMSAADKNDPYYKELMDTPWNVPRRLVSPEVQACTQCHEIGNAVYASTFINSLFSIRQRNDDGFKPAADELWRTRLFLSNVSATQRSFSFHDNKIRNEGLLPIKVSAHSIKEEDELRAGQSLEHYQKALHRINDCAKTPESCPWDQHWTLDRVKQEPLKYLQERCSYCHAPGMAEPVLLSETDFRKQHVAERIIARMNEPTYPMPPSGQLPSSTLDILAAYLRTQ